MDLKIVETRKNITVFQRIDTVSQFTVQFSSVAFIPDEMIVRNIIYIPDAPEPIISSLYLDLVQDTIGSIYQNLSINPDLRFILRKPVSGNWTFQLKNVAGNPDAVRVGDLIIHLEFVKLKEVKEGKIY